MDNLEIKDDMVSKTWADLDNVINELKMFNKQFDIPIIKASLPPIRNTFEGFSIWESYIQQQQPSHVITFKPLNLPTQEQIEHVFTQVKIRQNSAIYGALKVFGGYDKNNKQ